MAKKQGKRGRPAGSGENSGGGPILIRLSAEHRELLDRVRELTTIPTATWVRSIAIREARRLLGESD